MYSEPCMHLYILKAKGNFTLFICIRFRLFVSDIAKVLDSY